MNIAVNTQGLLHAIAVMTANMTDRHGALTVFMDHQDSLLEVRNILVDGGYTGEPFADETYMILGASIQVTKRNERNAFKVIPQRWIVKRSFFWIEKCRPL